MKQLRATLLVSPGAVEGRRTCDFFHELRSPIIRLRPDNANCRWTGIRRVSSTILGTENRLLRGTESCRTLRAQTHLVLRIDEQDCQSLVVGQGDGFGKSHGQ